jgi:hypothetical protein
MFKIHPLGCPDGPRIGQIDIYETSLLRPPQADEAQKWHRENSNLSIYAIKNEI